IPSPLRTLSTPGNRHDSHLHSSPTRRSSDLWLLTDPAEQASLYRELWELPSVAGIGTVAEAARNIRDYMKDTVLIFMGILLVLADRKSTRLNSSHVKISYAVFCLKKKHTHKK